jgi:asparagine synthase (glutamine-hydrolysing)
MCGIAGCVVAPGARPDERALERMASALAHRGPDDTGVVVQGTVGLVHTRLAIVDPTPAGHGPMRGPGGWWLAYNGEVFNHVALRRDLGEAVEWRGGSDTETVLRALERDGVDAVPRLNGLFAFAALDPAGQRLLLVRDRFGIKPLYVARHAGALWFASEIGALLAAGVPREPDRDVLAHALARGWANGPWTPIAGVERVMPGTAVTVDLQTLRSEERRWYDPLAAVDPSAPSAAADLEPALRASVERRLMADVPLGTMCSGGLDSSLITAFARDASAAPVHAFNASVVDQPDYDEGDWARRVADHLGVELHTVELTAESWRADLIGVVRHIEYPLTHESSVPMMQIAALARSRGVKVLLSGEGADELFGGYSWLHLEDAADFRARGRRGEAAARALYRLAQRRLGLGRQALREPLLGPSERVNRWERGGYDRSLGAYEHHRGARRRLEGGLAWDLATYLPHLLNRQDKSTMQSSVETRVPFLDPEVVRVALNMPLEQRVEPDAKQVLRDIAQRVLPPGVAQRPKVGFGFEVDRYLGGGAARPEFLAGGRLREVLGVADRDQWRARVAGAAGQSALLLWTAEIWCRQFLDGDGDQAVAEALWTATPAAAR